MNPADWQRVKEIFADALEQPASLRARFLQEACGNDFDLREEVESLLKSNDEDEHIIEKNALNFSQVFKSNGGNYKGKQFGHYKILREIGRGGMGAVFLAERTDGEFQQQVALKIVRQTIADSELERRVRRERQILASLNHPNIASLHDGGVSENGEPYLVMEYVEGEPLLTFSENQNLNIEERLRLFLKICSAVSYAHRNLIIHRDIKPSNIFVTKDGEPKLLDFGLAKILDEHLSDETQTATAFRAFTPSYASPEQIRGRNITTASDVYSLGVVLYELLTSERPFKTEEKSFEDILKEISEREPTKPSEVASSQWSVVSESFKDQRPKTKDQKSNRQSAIGNRQSLRGDLDNIVLMALRKEPERRYSSVELFANDIERHLKGLPVSARPNTFGYRASKFIRRNKLAFAATALVALAIVTGFAIALWQANVARQQRDRAEKRFNDVRKLSNSLLFEITPKIERLQGSTEAREVLVKRALEYLDSLAQESQDDLQLQSELASAYEKIGDLQGNPQKPNLGDFSGALASYEKANVIRGRLPKSAENQRLLAENFRGLSAARYYQNDVKSSLRDSAEALKIYESLAVENSESFELQTAFIETQIEQAQTYSFMNQHVVAIPLLRKTLAALEKLDQHNQKTQTLSARGFSLLGNSLSWDDKQPEAEIEMAKAVTIAESLATKYPNDTNVQQRVWRVYILASSIYEDINNEVSLKFAQRALKTAEKSVESDVANTQAKHNLAITFSRTGILSAHLKKLPDAVSNLEKAEKIFLDLMEREPKNRIYQNELGKLYTRFGDTKQKQGDLQGSLKAFQRSAELFEKISLTDEKNTLAQRDWAQALKSVGETLLKLSENEKAKEVYQRALEILNRLRDQNALGKFDEKMFDEVQTALRKL
jgi:serine/threonine protein kinase